MGLVKQPLIVMDADIMALRNLSTETIAALNSVDFAMSSDNLIWFFNHLPFEKFEWIISAAQHSKIIEKCDILALNEVFKEKKIIEDLCSEAKSNEITTFSRYSECGNFSKNDWEKGKKIPPFSVSYALKTTDMSLNENKVLTSWGQMAELWDVINQIKV